VRAALADFVDPEIGLPLGRFARIDADAGGGSVSAWRVGLPFPAELYRERLAVLLGELLEGLDLPEVPEVSVRWQVPAAPVHGGLPGLPGVRNVLAIASGKGGVGKSTTTVNLALALAAEVGLVGVLDADIYGPSQPRMLGLTGRRPTSPDGRRLNPVSAHGIQCMSIGFLVDDDQPMIWRGPMATQALSQLLGETGWDDLDYLLVDMPPGTGDIQLTMSQRVPVTGALVVTTPQDIALQDAIKGLKMFEKVEIPVLGIVENMSSHICSRCGHEEPIFGTGGGQRMSEQYGVPLLGTLPLDKRIREETDGGCPTVVAEPQGPIAAAYIALARRAGVAIGALAGGDAGFPEILIEDD
jgi:ATP-binding protein involved in chromosome partitioning